MKGYKGYEKGLICRGKQYAVGEVFEEDNARICNSGMHFCALPHQVFEHYLPGDNHEFTEVEALDEVYTDDERKYCTKKLKIGAKISVFDICKISVAASFERFGFSDKIKSAYTNNAGDRGAANAGNRGAANAGDCGAANAGDRGAANAGNYGAANAGNYGAANAGNRGAANAGNRGAANAGNRGAANAGDCGAANAGNRGAANAGDCGAANAGYCGAANAGYYGAANAGNRGAAIVRKAGAASVGQNGVAIGLGNGAKACGKKNAVLVLVRYDDDDNVSAYKAIKVDGKRYKEDTYYTLGEDGKVVMAE